MDNFDTIKDEFPEIYELAVDTERYVFMPGARTARPQIMKLKDASLSKAI